MLKILFSLPAKWNILWKRVLSELEIIGVSSLFIVGLMSLFMGGVIALNTAYQLTTPLLPDYTVGYITQQSTFLEFSPTVTPAIIIQPTLITAPFLINTGLIVLGYPCFFKNSFAEGFT